MGSRADWENPLVTAAEVAIVVRHTKEIVYVALGRPRVHRLSVLVRERWREEGGKVEPSQGILHLRLDLARGKESGHLTARLCRGCLPCR